MENERREAHFDISVLVISILYHCAHSSLDTCSVSSHRSNANVRANSSMFNEEIINCFYYTRYECTHTRVA